MVNAQSGLNEVVVYTQDDIDRTLKRLTHELLEANHGCADLAIIGILTRGKYIAERVVDYIQSFEGVRVPLGTLDITLYRDDSSQTFKKAQQSQIPFDITNKHVILVDDVIFSGRTIRAALDALNDYGRPASVQLLVLLDRGHRELPISPNYIGKNIPTAKTDRVNVRLKEVDNQEQVTLTNS